MPDNLIYSNVPSQIPLPMDTVHPNLPVRPILKKDSVYRVRVYILFILTIYIAYKEIKKAFISSIYSLNLIYYN